MFNYDTYQSDLLFVGERVVPGYKMFSLEEYPYCIKTTDENDIIKVELFKILNQQTEQMIHEMEIEAGYIFEELEIAKQKFGIYLFPSSKPEHVHVVSGDWVLYKKAAGF